MILYHVITSYHLLNAMVYHMVYGQNDKAVVLLSEWLPEKFPNFNELGHFFDKIIVDDANYRFLHSKEETNTYFQSLLGDMSMYSQIFIWGAQFSFGIWAEQEGYTFVYGEEAAGRISRPHSMDNIEKNTGIKGKYYDLIKNLGLYDGTATHAVKVICNAAAQQQDYQPPKEMIDFNVTSELQKLPEDKRGEILDFFLPKRGKIDVRENTTVLLTQHFTNLGLLTFEEQVLIYQLVIDYFFEKSHISIKPHPDDIMYYSQLFPDTQVIREKFPSEFMPFIFEHQPKCIATISSTAIDNLRGTYEKIFELDARYEEDFLMTHRYYVALFLAKELKLNVVCIRANELLAKQLSNTLGEGAPNVMNNKTDVHRSCLFLIDNVTEDGEEGRKKIQNFLETMDENSCAIFINSQEDYCWYDYYKKGLWNDIIPLVLTKKRKDVAGEDFYAPIEDEVLYVYSRNKELLKAMKETTVTKDLKNTGIRVTMKNLSPEEEKIKMLEGILAATEKQLLYYMGKEQERK